MSRILFDTEKPTIKTIRSFKRDCTTQAKDYLSHSIKKILEFFLSNHYNIQIKNLLLVYPVPECNLMFNIFLIFDIGVNSRAQIKRQTDREAL